MRAGLASCSHWVHHDLLCRPKDPRVKYEAMCPNTWTKLGHDATERWPQTQRQNNQLDYHKGPNLNLIENAVVGPSGSWAETSQATLKGSGYFDVSEHTKSETLLQQRTPQLSHKANSVLIFFAT